GGTTITGYAPAMYPNTWLRLKRVGNVFTGYSSLDGNSWQTLGSISLPLASSLYVGVGVTSRNAGQSTTTQIRDYGNVQGGTIASLVINKEPLGASSRKTGLVISEIMYHPRSLDTNHSLEFVEIFNSNPFFENIGGYRISGSVDYTFPANTVIQAGTFLVVARDPAFVQSFYGITGVLGPWQGSATNNPGISTNSLPGGSGTVRLRNPAGAVLLEVQEEGRPTWPLAP